MKQGRLLLIPSLLLLILVPACERNHYRVNISSVTVNTRIVRFEKDLFTLDPGNINPALQRLKTEYPGFLQLFSWVINTGNIEDQAFGENLQGFITDRLNNEVYDSVLKIYPDLSALDNELNRAFRHYRYYFPGKKIPAIYTCITGFNNSIITGDSVLGISLDRYLGKNSGYYRRLQVYKYVAERMTPENVVPDCVYGWGSSEWDFEAMKYPVDNVLCELIHEGKLKYFGKCMLPDVPDELLFGFTPDQMKFCRNNEDQMWEYLIEKNLLFSTEKFTLRKLVGEAPFTSYFSNESPGRAAVWIGFRLVESFMIKNPDYSLDELMNETDIQKILEKARYNP